MFKSTKYWNDKYKNGENISLAMREEININYNSEEIIEMSYELQSGSYINGMKDETLKNYRKNYSNELSSIIKNLSSVTSILEVGIGEGTTLSGVMNNFPKEVKFYGFDLSWSRVAYAKKWLNSLSFYNHSLCTGNLSDIPFLDNSIDIVYTSHSIEPNRGREEEILRELFRVTNKYLILLEPAYELTNDENRNRMDNHKYCKNLVLTAENLGYKVIKHELFKHNARESNPTAITIIEKNSEAKSLEEEPFACPLYKTKLGKEVDCYYSEEAMSIYPIVNGIACLRKENKILATKYKEITENE